jgi:Asp-tRNA(Asn)/Glu-tRNA(Gln) amidotransferase A subunit family amidase
VFAATITVPSGVTDGGLPAGITFLGPAYAEPTLLKLAYAYEQATRHSVCHRRPRRRWRGRLR